MNGEPTIQFRIKDNDPNGMRALLKQIYEVLESKGYNSINQLVGYILSEDPTYITTHNNARSLIRRVDRDELLQEMLKVYLEL